MKWYKKSEEVPPINLKVLAYVERNDTIYINYRAHCDAHGRDLKDFTLKGVTHWAYLPGKPNEDNLKTNDGEYVKLNDVLDILRIMECGRMQHSEKIVVNFDGENKEGIETPNAGSIDPVLFKDSERRNENLIKYIVAFVVFATGFAAGIFGWMWIVN